MPTYNAGKFLSDSIDSILAQTYQNLELVISDDGSTDPLTLDILKRYAKKDSRVKVEYLQGNHGPGIARNRSIDRAHGRYIAFCDSDDRWMPDKLERQIAHMDEKNSPICSASYLICDEKSQTTGIRRSPAVITYSMMKRDNKIGCLTAIYDTKRLGHKFYMPAIRKRQDWALFLTILRQCQVCYAITEPLAYYRLRSDSVSSNKLSLIKYNLAVYEDILGFSWLKARLYFFCLFLPAYYTKVLKRKWDSRLYMRKNYSS